MTMKKLTFYLSLMLALCATNLFAVSINTSTAWFNGETFESYTAPYDFKTAGTAPWSGWTSSYAVITQTIASQSTGSATGNVLGFTVAANTTTAFGQSTLGGARTWNKNNFTSLSGRYVYGKTSYFNQTGGNGTGVTYSLRNSTGGIVFEFGGNGATSNDLWFTGVNAATVLMGVRANWADIEFVLDLVSNKAVKVIVTYNGTSKSYSDITLAAGTNINTLFINESKGTGAAGLDNTTIGNLVSDNIKTLASSQNTHQTLDATTVNTNLNVTAFTTAMGIDLNIPKTDLNVNWSVTDWGGLSLDDQAKISLTRGDTDNTTATLTTTSAISATTADIVVTANYNGTTLLTKTITVKGVDIAGLKASLLSEINAANGLMTAVTDDNGYISSAKSTLSGVVATAQGVYDNAAATVSDITTATTNLQSAKTTFNSAMATYNNFVTYIGTVTSGKDAESRTAPFFTAIKATLSSAIDAALAAKATVVTAGDISTAQTTLEGAYSQYTTQKPAYDNLISQMTLVTNKLTAVNPRKGDTRFLMFPTANVDALSAANAAAQSVLDNGTTTTELNTSISDLQTALTTFGNLARVAPSTSYYRIFTYGVNDGEGSVDKKVLFAYYDAGTSSYLLRYAYMSSVTALALGDNALWTIAVGSANNKYTLLNKATGTYLSGTGFSSTPAEFTFPENSSQAGLISYGTDTYTEYGIVNSSAKGLEIDAYDTNTKLGVFLNNASMANRFRFAYQFELPATSTLTTTEASVPVFSGIPSQTTNKTLTLAGTNLFGDIAMSITGTDASLFSVAPTTLSPINTIISANTITVSYTPQSTRTGYDEATLNIVAADGTAINYLLQGECLATQLNSADQTSLNAYVNQRTLVVTGAEAYEVYNVQGIKIASITNTSTKVNLQPGVYFVKTTDKTVKVFVK